MKILLIASVLTSSLLMGCANTEYLAYSKAQTEIEVSKNLALSAKYKAMEVIAQSGDATAKVAAVMALSMQGQGGSATGASIAAPAPNQALQWASVLVPGVTQVLGMRYQYLSTVTQSNNSAAVAQSTNASFVGIAGKIQAQNTSNTSNTSNTILSGTGSLGTGTYGVSSIDSTDNTSVPTVVTQPTPTVVNPLVVTQPTPLVINPVVVPTVSTGTTSVN